MFGKRVKLFSILGFEVRADASWLIIAVFITWTLAEGLFPYRYRNLPDTTYWWMGIFGAIGLFGSIVVHELCHSLVARRYGIQMKGITLFIFGGVAEMEKEPESAKVEFLMAAAGPASSAALGLGLYAVHAVGWKANWPISVEGVIIYLAYINWLLAGFNLLPAFPLDGGRIFRSALWKWKNDIKWATRMASRSGSLFGTFLILLGIMNVLWGSLLAGLWWFMIGMFLRTAAQSSYKQVLLRRAFEGETVESFMVKEPVTVPPTVSIRQFVEDYVYRHHFKMFPVEENGRLAGCVTTKQVKAIPRKNWDLRTVGELAARCSRENAVSPDEDIMSVLSTMNRTRNSRLMVAEPGTGALKGIITLKDIMNFFSIKLELEE
jgi:Zn-dependent protease